MKRGAPLKRTPFKRKPLPQHQPAIEREPKPLARATRAATYGGTTSGQVIEKERPVRSEAYRRLVAALPCSCGCGRQPCQAAHPNTGKGMAMKTDDRRCFPLAPPCHAAFDQGVMFPKDSRRQWEERWGVATRAAILAAGKWPANVPQYEEKNKE